MNYYYTQEFENKKQALKDKYYSKLDFNNPSEIKNLSDNYFVERYRITEPINEGNYSIKYEICRLLFNSQVVYEWSCSDCGSSIMDIIHHTNGHTYLIFTEDLYGYSVLELDTLKSVHYLPSKSYSENEEIEETFIWCDSYYNEHNNFLAVAGCFWACPESIIVLDFSDPLNVVEANKWYDIRLSIDPDYEKYCHIVFKSWDNDLLICKPDGVPEDENMEIPFDVKSLSF